MDIEPIEKGQQIFRDYEKEARITIRQVKMHMNQLMNETLSKGMNKMNKLVVEMIQEINSLRPNNRRRLNLENRLNIINDMWNNYLATYQSIVNVNNNITGAGIYKKETNTWIQHVKNYASKNNMSYKDALRDPKCKSCYSSCS
jgi:hypothetical protein